MTDTTFHTRPGPRTDTCHLDKFIFTAPSGASQEELIDCVVSITRQILRKCGFVALLWHIDDVRVAQERLDDTTSLSDEECLAILDSIERDHDADHGVSWETLADALEDHLARHPRTEATR